MHCGLFGRQSTVVVTMPKQVWISPRVRSIPARDQLSELALTASATPFIVAARLLANVRLFLSEPLIQALPAGRLRKRGTELKGASVPVTGVPGVVAVAVHRCVLDAITLKQRTDIIASSHVPPRNSRIAAGQASDQRSPADHISPKAGSSVTDVDRIRGADPGGAGFVEPDGWCGPLEYGFPRDFGLGDIRSTPLPELADAWAVTLYPRFRDVVAASLSQQHFNARLAHHLLVRLRPSRRRTRRRQVTAQPAGAQQPAASHLCPRMSRSRRRASRAGGRLLKVSDLPGGGVSPIARSRLPRPGPRRVNPGGGWRWSRRW